MKSRRQRMEDVPAQEVTRVEHVVLEGPEHFAFVRGVPVLPARGGITFMRMLDQAMDGVNVVALELTLAGEKLPEIRRLDAQLALKIARLVRKTIGAEGTEAVGQVDIRLAVIIG